MFMKKIGIFLLVCMFTACTVPNNTTRDTDNNTSERNISGEVTVGSVQEESEFYTLSVEYPMTDNEEVNENVIMFINNYIAEFTEVAESSQEEIPYTLSIDFDIHSYSDEIYSFVFDVYEYIGGAHGDGFVVTKTFNSNTGEQLYLDDVFSDNDQFLEQLSANAMPLLEYIIDEYSDPDWVRDGTAPVLENYERFALSDEYLMIFFNPYQVAPYSEGVIEIKIPLDDLTISL